MSNQQARLSSGGVSPERVPGTSRPRSRDDALVLDTPSRSSADPAAGGTPVRTHPDNWQLEAGHIRHPYTPQWLAGVLAPPALPLLVPLTQWRIRAEEAESIPTFGRASHSVSICACNSQSYHLGLRLQELVQAGQAAPGCLRYELYQVDGNAGPWLLHSEWSDEAAMQAYLSGDTQRVFAGVLWQTLTAAPDVQERPF